MYVIRRLLLVILVLLGLSVVTFVISHMVPGDPVRLAAGPQATGEQIRKLEAEFSLDKPLLVQYLNYMKGVLRGDLGRSLNTRRPVATDLRRCFPATLELTIASRFLGVVIGIPLAMAAAVFKDRWPDQFSL